MKGSIRAAIAAGFMAGGMAAAPGHAAQIIASGTPGTTGATALFMTLPSEVSAEDGSGATPAELLTFLGAPDDNHIGIGQYYIQYDLGTYRMVDGAGQDFNVYEVDGGNVEFGSVDVLVSADGITFFNLEASFAAAIDLAGDEAHGNAAFRRSYDLAGAVTALGVSEFRYLRLDGTGSGAINGDNGFDPDSVGFASFIDTAPVTAVPESATWGMMILGFGAVGASLRGRRRTVRAAA